MEYTAVAQTKQSVKNEIMSKPGIVGLGVGYKTTEGESTGELSVVVMVREKVPLAALDPTQIVPTYLGRVPTDVIQVGHIRTGPPAPSDKDRTDKWRPAPGGVSIGHYQITAGTFGAVVQEPTTELDLILSNNHVVANSNDANLGDKVLQPGPYDGGSSTDAIGKLYQFIEIDFGQMNNGDCPFAESYAYVGNLIARLFRSKQRVKTLQTNPQAINYVDAGLVLPDDRSLIEDRIIDIGTVQGHEAAVLGMKVMKSGRTTEFTRGTIDLIRATITVDYGGGRRATFENQLVAGAMSQGGDSGSLLVSSANKQAVGLLFAGSNQATIFNPIDEVLNALHISI